MQGTGGGRGLVGDGRGRRRRGGKGRRGQRSGRSFAELGEDIGLENLLENRLEGRLFLRNHDLRRRGHRMRRTRYGWSRDLGRRCWRRVDWSWQHGPLRGRRGGWRKSSLLLGTLGQRRLGARRVRAYQRGRKLGDCAGRTGLGRRSAGRGRRRRRQRRGSRDVQVRDAGCARDGGGRLGNGRWRRRRYRRRGDLHAVPQRGRSRRQSFARQRCDRGRLRGRRRWR